MALRAPHKRYLILMVTVVGCSGEAGPGGRGVSGGSSGAQGGAHTSSGGSIVIVQGGASNSSGGSGGRSGDGGASSEAVCGDGVVDAPAGEECDDGDEDPANGCDNSCKLVDGWLCIPGKPCQVATTCGNGELQGSEECDDGNTRDTDGCTANCLVADGWRCPVEGASCEARECGDGLIAGVEQCDDGNARAGDGCSSACKIESGYFCPGGAGEECKKTVCGNGIEEGDESCDDGNSEVGDGCSPFCVAEPDCGDGACVSSCGDGITLPDDDEECDDGNRGAGDGCSPTCTVEEGFTCEPVPEAEQDHLSLPIVYRDFIRANGEGGHPDFHSNSHSGPWKVITGAVSSTLVNGKPVLNTPPRAKIQSSASFQEWFGTSTRSQTIVDTMTLTAIDPGKYQFHSNGFFPLDGRGWVAEGSESREEGKDSSYHNFSFTSEIRYWFEYKGGESLSFKGDDDLWVFFNKQLVVDLGGIHAAATGEVTLDATTASQLGMEVGKVYEAAVFHAERRPFHSNYQLTLGNFNRNRSSCESTCGDGIVAADEVCDDGDDNGSYGHCREDCLGRGPHCGDGRLQESEGEVCDDGLNVRAYVFKPEGDIPCAPGCQLASYCGDGVVDSEVGEECDGNLISGQACPDSCAQESSCGDGVVDEGEACDDGNRKANDGCSPYCHKEFIH